MALERAILARWGLTALAGTGLILWLSWIDVLPGGWTLRGWVEPHAQREARARAEHSDLRLQRFAVENRNAPPGCIVFAGSSTIERFPLASLFPSAPTQNRGIGDESCEEFLARYQASRPSARVGGWVLYMASVDFRRLNSSPLQIRDRVARVLDRIRTDDGPVPVTLIGILPEQDMPPAMVQRLKRTDRVLADLCTELGARYVSTRRAPITDNNGSLSAAFAADDLHLNEKGYAILVEWIAASLPELAPVTSTGQ